MMNRYRWLRFLFPVTGLAALIWFLARVIPKPSRATYPCQRTAFPIASAFVIWLIGTVSSIAAFKRAQTYMSRARYVIAGFCIVISVTAVFFALTTTNESITYADDPIPNVPVGTARGINPGRVVWVHDPNASDWAGAGEGYWFDDSITNPDICKGMLSSALQNLSGSASNTAAWDDLFRYFNQQKGKGDIGYQAGEKIIIKLNFVIFHLNGNIDENGDQIGGFNCCFNSPQMVLALIGQLVNRVGVDPCDITVGSTLDGMPSQFYNPIQAQFPGVVCLNFDGLLGRTKAVRSTTDFLHWSAPGAHSYVEGVPICFAEAEYLVNFALLKGHPSAGITACAKNNFGSFLRTPMNYWKLWDDNYLDIHKFLPDAASGMGNYRPQVDLMGSSYFDGKGLLWLIDGLYGAPWHNTDIVPWDMPPFNGDWPCSLFASQDPVAIDSVGYDFLWTEFNDVGTDYGRPHMSGTEDYLHEAALADSPPSGTFYDPDGNSVGLDSLGVHEHWDNEVDKQYSRNLGTGDGIELVAVMHDLSDADFNSDSRVNFLDYAELADVWMKTAGEPDYDDFYDLYDDEVINMLDMRLFLQHWLE
ncbi:MAG: DUF362 domain-containing protein [Sedimentisphaerales bacterium]|nr:DUF362 domain-containing protein [Sedimentisphaerales bacterium]